VLKPYIQRGATNCCFPGVRWGFHVELKSTGCRDASVDYVLLAPLSRSPAFSYLEVRATSLQVQIQSAQSPPKLPLGFPPTANGGDHRWATSLRTQCRIILIRKPGNTNPGVASMGTQQLQS